MLLYKICAVIIFMSSIVLAYYDLVCPDGSQRQLRSHGLCMRKNNTNSVYSCLENIFTDTFNESCSEVEDFVRPGNRFVIKGRATIGECSTGRYQPIKFDKTSGPDCIFLKSTCTEVGQVVARNGSGFIDTTCICDYTEGYAYVTRPHDVCNCVPSEEDCSCYVKLCPENKFLSADNECIHTCSNVTNVKKCGTIDKSGKKFTTTTNTTVRTDSTAFNESPTREKYDAVTVIITLTLMLYGVVICVMLYTFDNVPFISNIDIKRKNSDTCFHEGHIIKQPVKKDMEPQTLVVESPENMAILEEELNFIRILKLVIYVGPKAVRETFDKYFPPVNWTTIMKEKEPEFKELQAKKQLTKSQMTLLFPTTGVTSSSDFDINLMICLLCKFTKIPRPVNGFDVLPPSTDIHDGADLARVKYYRNKIAHSWIDRIPTSEFTTVWNDFEQAVVRLGGSNVKAMCDDIKHLYLYHDISLKVPDKTRQVGEETTAQREKITSREINQQNEESSCHVETSGQL